MSELADDLLKGADAVARYLGISRRQIYHYTENGYLPVFRIGTAIFARRTTLSAWVADQERAATPRRRGSRVAAVPHDRPADGPE